MMRNTKEAAGSRLTAAGRWGFALLAVHTALLFLPPVPPVHKGSSVPGYALSLFISALLAIEVRRQAPAILAWWRGHASAGLRAGAAAVIAAGLGLAFAMRAALPEPFRRFSREEGLWEPLTLVAYLVAALLLARAIAGLEPRAGRPWRLLVAFYVWLALEEVDYFGIFGGWIGRIHGVYVGSLHDVIRLTAFGGMGGAAWAVLIGAALLVAAFLWRAGYLRPAWIAARLTDPRLAWALAGMILLWIAAIDDAEMFGWLFAMPSPEEALELAGGACLAVYALEQAAQLAA